jgi:exopolysaccharide biosynthesis WecB/TagA/CpsF family protein
MNVTTSDEALLRISVLGVRVDKLTCAQALTRISAWGETPPRMLAYVNAHTLNLAFRDKSLREALADSDLVMNDGIGLNLAARMRGDRFPENLNGSDFTIKLLELAAQRDWGVFLFGGQPGVADAATRRLIARIEDLKVVGTLDGFSMKSDQMIAQHIRDTRAKLLVVALGSPIQELWLAQNLHATGAVLGVGVGAFLDFNAGRVRRAPRWMNRLGLEWCFRLTLEPGRLWRRYVIGNPLFLSRAWRDR